MKHVNKKHLSRLALLMVLVLGLLMLAGCMGTGSTQSLNDDGTMKLIEVDNLSTETSMSVWDYIKLPFSYLLEFLYNISGNYGVALILFAVLVKLLLFPTSAMSKKSTMKMSRLTPRVKALEAKYGDDKQKYNAEVQKLYKEEGAGGCAGCLWSLLPLLILIPLYQIIREPITWLMFHGKTNAVQLGEIQNVFINARNAAYLSDPTSALANMEATGFYWQMQALPFIGEVKNELAAIAPSLYSMNTSFLGIELATVPHLAFWNYFGLGVWNAVGQFLLPMISGGISMLSMWLGQKMNATVVVDKDGNQDPEMAKQSNPGGKSMMYMMPLMSVYIGFVAPAGLSIYWITQGVLGMVQDWFLTKRYKKIYDAEDAIKQERAAKEAALEAERERIRAEKRAENPDGITANTSKKKLQQRERNEQAAKEAAYQAQQAAQESREEELTRQLEDGSRPYRRGRAYRPDRYSGSDKNQEE